MDFQIFHMKARKLIRPAIQRVKFPLLPAFSSGDTKAAAGTVRHGQGRVPGPRDGRERDGRDRAGDGFGPAEGEELHGPVVQAEAEQPELIGVWAETGGAYVIPHPVLVRQRDVGSPCSWIVHFRQKFIPEVDDPRSIVNHSRLVRNDTRVILNDAGVVLDDPSSTVDDARIETDNRSRGISAREVHSPGSVRPADPSALIDRCPRSSCHTIEHLQFSSSPCYMGHSQHFCLFVWSCSITKGSCVV